MGKGNSIFSLSAQFVISASLYFFFFLWYGGKHRERDDENGYDGDAHDDDFNDEKDGNAHVSGSNGHDGDAHNDFFFAAIK